jgi:2-polyprenyl-6-methoxyphenol hydroxylase-like FAD-dependent oxidoreductase
VDIVFCSSIVPNSRATPFRLIFGPGWALVGDAGHHKDPMQARGIRDAFRDAELLVEAIDAGHNGGQPVDVALALYEQRRNAAALPVYESLCRALTFPAVSDEEGRLTAAVAEDQALTNRMLGLRAGTITQAEFLAAAPEHIRRLWDAVSKGPATGTSQQRT